MTMTRKRTPILPRKTILISTANAAIAAYFSRVRKACRYVNMTVEYIPSDSVESFIKATGKARIAGKFASAWAVFGLSDFNLEPADLEGLKDLAESRKVKLGWTTPNISMWLYLHLTKQAPNFYVENASQFDQQIAKYFPGYKPTAEFMTGEGSEIHLKLFKFFAMAVNNASAYNKIAEKKNGVPATTFVELYDDIKEICGDADLSHNNKVLAQ